MLPGVNAVSQPIVNGAEQQSSPLQTKALDNWLLASSNGYWAATNTESTAGLLEEGKSVPNNDATPESSLANSNPAMVVLATDLSSTVVLTNAQVALLETGREQNAAQTHAIPDVASLPLNEGPNGDIAASPSLLSFAFGPQVDSAIIMTPTTGVPIIGSSKTRVSLDELFWGRLGIEVDWLEAGGVALQNGQQSLDLTDLDKCFAQPWLAETIDSE